MTVLRCDACPLRNQRSVAGTGRENPVGVIVGQAPGDQEVARGVPFIGPAGQWLRSVLREAHVDDDEVHFTNAVLCHPGKKVDGRDKAPTQSALDACRSRLRDEIIRSG
jgi:DNA polymerase